MKATVLPRLNPLRILLLILLFSAVLWSGISGIVFRDLPMNGTTPNVYGVRESNEPGIKGVTVTAYPGGETTTTAADGSFMGLKKKKMLCLLLLNEVP